MRGMRGVKTIMPIGDQPYQGKVEADSCDDVKDAAPIAIGVGHPETIHGRLNGRRQPLA